MQSPFIKTEGLVHKNGMIDRSKHKSFLILVYELLFLLIFHLI